MTPTNSLERAIRMALDCHDGQRRKASGLPYIVHPLEVVKRLSDLGVQRKPSEHVLCAAALHDVLEDSDMTTSGLRAAFSADVAGIVGELTFEGGSMSKPDYLASLAEGSIEALVIKLVDRACNVDDFLHSDPEYAPIYAAKASPIYAAIEARRAEIETAFGGAAADALVREAGRLAALSRH